VSCSRSGTRKDGTGVLARPKFAFPADEIAALLAVFRRQGELVVPKASGTVSVDPGDTKFLQCAETAQTDYLVTGNKRPFRDANHGATRVASAGKLLDWITLEV
jgi:predicted nucleic acid-binding protein